MLPHDPYITAVTTALTAAELEPTENWTEDGELDSYRDDEHAGAATMLNAYLVWDDEHPALDTAKHRHGIGDRSTRSYWQNWTRCPSRIY